MRVPDAHPTERRRAPFCVVTGAVDKRALRTASLEWTTYEPTMPYVIPRLLDMPRMVATLTAIPDAFVVAYFGRAQTEDRAADGALAANEFQLHHADERRSWRSRTTCGFDSEPWIAKGN